METIGFVYIITNKHNTTVNVGVTSEIVDRIYKHKIKIHPDSYSARYNLYKLVYFEIFPSISLAIKREKQLKKMSRKKKNDLISAFNPEWNELDAEDAEKGVQEL